MACGACGTMRSYFPAAIRKRLEEVERRIEAKKRIEIKYNVTGASVPSGTPGSCSPCRAAAGSSNGEPLIPVGGRQ